MTNKQIPLVLSVAAGSQEESDRLEEMARAAGAHVIGVPVHFQQLYTKQEVDLATQVFAEVMQVFVETGPEDYSLHPMRVAACLVELMNAVDEQVQKMPDKGEEQTDAATTGE